jgi:opacity protein-like surface antigen
MRTFVLAATFAALSVSAAYAEDVMASRYGNTTITTDAAGIQAKIYYNADHTFSGNQNGQNFKGTWKLDEAGSTICLTYDSPPTNTPNPLCAPIAAHKVGDKWSAVGRNLTLVQGIQ